MINMLVISVVGVMLAGWLVDRLQLQVGKSLKLLLAFSGSLLLGIAIFELFPCVFEQKLGPIAIIIGFILQLLLEMTTSGMEHGHIHTEHLNKFPVGLFVGLCLHALFEATPLSMHGHGHEGHTHTHSHSLFTAIIVHKLPISAVLMIFMIAGGIPKLKAYLSLFLFALMIPLNLAVLYFIKNYTEIEYVGLFNFISGISAGMILHVATTILLETSNDHRFNLLKFSTVVAGFVCAFFMA